MECWNMAALYTLPVIFLCENNLYSEMTPLERSHGNTNLKERAKGFGLNVDEVDGNDPIAVFKCMSKAVKKARTGGGASFIEAFTYRTTGHYQADPGTSYRTKEEVEEWRAKSPITTYAKKLGSAAAIIEKEESALIRIAVEKALNAPAPDPSQAATEVFA
jgi:pyruvate dehydrogenase E1 component alpha subunit